MELLSSVFLNFIVILIMKRKPSQELTTPSGNSKEVLKRLKSPQGKRLPIKKAQQISSIILQKHKGLRSREEHKPDSNNTTASTKSKNIKPSRKIRDKSFKELGEQQIMKIINSFATKIQRQWRAYSFRKHLFEFMALMKAERKKEAQSEPSFLSLRNHRVEQVARFEEEEISSGTTLYDRQKYDSFSSYKQSNNCDNSRAEKTGKSKSQSNIPASKSSSITPRSYVEQSASQIKIPRDTEQINQQLSRSLEKPLSYRQYQQSTIQARRASFNPLEQRRAVENRRHSTGELPPKRSVSQKQLQIGKAYQIVIQQSGDRKKQMSQGSPCKRRVENEGTIAFKKGSSIQKMMQKCKKQLQITKLKQLLSVENRYSKNQVSHLKYIEIIDKINQEHTSKLQQIQTKEGRLKNALGQLLQAYKGRFLEDDPQGSSHLDVSLSFDKWDFNSSAKKSIDHFDFPENNNSKVLSIESVLRELEEEDAGGTSDERRFKKNKSLQMIEAIAQRSKEISEKDVASFEENPGNGVQAIRIKEPEESREHSQVEFEQEKKEIVDEQNSEIVPMSVKAQQKSVCQLQKTPEKLKSLSQIRSVKQIEDCVSSQSLLITPAGAPELIPSQQDINAAPSAEMIRQLIYKEIKTVSIDYSDPSVSKFRELVIEKILMTNIKLINSIKFVFAKAGEERKRLKKLQSQMPSIDTDINAINTWLLQISHFVLDSYQQVLRDNLHRVKQPPITEVLAMARKGLSTIPTYQTIPEFIYKDFEFYFIKTLQKTYNVNSDNYASFSSVVYTFHRVLVDALNEALMEELITGKDWIRTPWKMPKKFKVVKESYDQVKLCLQRSINVVSNWGEYGLGRLVLDDDFSEAQYRQFQEEKIKLVCRQEILNEALNPSFSVGNVMLEIAEWVYQTQLQRALLQTACIQQSK